MREYYSQNSKKQKRLKIERRDHRRKENGGKRGRAPIDVTMLLLLILAVHTGKKNTNTGAGHNRYISNAIWENICLLWHYCYVSIIYGWTTAFMCMGKWNGNRRWCHQDKERKEVSNNNRAVAKYHSVWKQVQFLVESVVRKGSGSSGCTTPMLLICWPHQQKQKKSSHTVWSRSWNWCMHWMAYVDDFALMGVDKKTWNLQFASIKILTLVMWVGMSFVENIIRSCIHSNPDV